MSNHCTDFMDYEIGAVEGLLKLKQPTEHFATLSPMHPLQQETNHRLPSLSNLLLPFHHQDQPLYSINDDVASIYSCSTYQPSLIPPLSTSTSFSSLRSCASSTKSTQKASLLSRAATFTGRRRGRPRKPTEIKIVDMSSYYPNESAETPPPSNKPRWQEAERLELLEAIVKEKELDDMTTIRWDRISLAVGRAKKACKDQWRRELLPNIMRGLRPSSSNSKKTDA